MKRTLLEDRLADRKAWEVDRQHLSSVVNAQSEAIETLHAEVVRLTKTVDSLQMGKDNQDASVSSLKPPAKRARSDASQPAATHAVQSLKLPDASIVAEPSQSSTAKLARADRTATKPPSNKGVSVHEMIVAIAQTKSFTGDPRSFVKGLGSIGSMGAGAEAAKKRDCMELVEEVLLMTKDHDKFKALVRAPDPSALTRLALDVQRRCMKEMSGRDGKKAGKPYVCGLGSRYGKHKRETAGVAARGQGTISVLWKKVVEKVSPRKRPRANSSDSE